jgi:hypothetical protein
MKTPMVLHHYPSLSLQCSAIVIGPRRLSIIRTTRQRKTTHETTTTYVAMPFDHRFSRDYIC